MRIIGDSFERIHQLQFINAAKRGGVESRSLPFLIARAEGLPPDVDALVLTSDLQGVTPAWRHGGQNVLLGIQVAEELFDLAEAGTIPSPSETSIILAGDLFSAPGGDKRGASGDVRDVWLAFSVMNRWVAGVGGNHDRFGTPHEKDRFCATENIDLLDGDLIVKDGIRIGGVSLIIGNPEKPGRCEEDEFLAALDVVLEQSPDILVLHEGPSGSRDQRGNPYIRERLERSPSALVVCGHVHWREPLAMLEDQQVLNVDSRVVILTR